MYLTSPLKTLPGVAYNWGYITTKKNGYDVLRDIKGKKQMKIFSFP
jgi:hypothetical protein